MMATGRRSGGLERNVRDLIETLQVATVRFGYDFLHSVRRRRSLWLTLSGDRFSRSIQERSYRHRAGGAPWE